MIVKVSWTDGVKMKTLRNVQIQNTKADQQSSCNTRRTCRKRQASQYTGYCLRAVHTHVSTTSIDTQNKHAAETKKYLHLSSGTLRIWKNSRNLASHHVHQPVARENIYTFTATPPVTTEPAGAHVNYWEATCYRQNIGPRWKN